MHVQDGIARSYNWPNLALLPPYIIRQLIVIGLMGGAWAIGMSTDATTGIVIAAISIWACAIGQFLVLNRKLATEVPAGDKSYDIRRWIAVSVPMFVVDSLYVVLMYVDVLILKQFRPPEEIAIYYAAVKTLALVSFVYFAVAAASAHKFSEYFVAGDRKRLAEFVGDAIRWTFWPSLAATLAVLACGWPLLWLFGESFVTGYYLMFILAIGILARAAIGPGERFLSMLGQQKSCALAAMTALATNVGLCLFLVPKFGIKGAAIATAIAFVVEFDHDLRDREEAARLSSVHLGRAARLAPALVLLPQNPPDHLAGRGHRHLVDEGDLARIFVRRQPGLDEFLEFGGERLARRGDTGLQHDERLDDFGAHRIGLADDGRERHRRMPDQAILDLARPDAIARRGDDIVVAPDEMEIAFVVGNALIAGRHPVADELLARRIGLAPVFQKHHRVGPQHRDLPDLARLASRAPRRR